MNGTNSTSLVRGKPTDLSIWYWIVRVSITVVTVLGNIIVVYLIATRTRLQNNPNWFIFSLAVSDCLIGLFVTPLELICLVFDACIKPMELRFTFYNFLIQSSITNLCAITLDRYLAIVHSLRYPIVMTTKCVVLMIALSWFLPLILTMPSLFWSKERPDVRDTADKAHMAFQIFFVTLLPCVVLIAAYARIFVVANKQRRRFSEQICQLRHNDRSFVARKFRTRDGSSTAVKVLGVVIPLFVLCWVPSLYRAICGYFISCHIHVFIVQISRIMMLANSGVNFVVYAFLKKDIRTELQRCCHRQTRQRQTSFELSVMTMFSDKDWSYWVVTKPRAWVSTGIGAKVEFCGGR